MPQDLTQWSPIHKWVDLDYTYRFRMLNPACFDFEVFHGGDEEERFIHGFIRFDGCANFDVGERGGCMVHTCDKQAAINIGVAMGRLYDLAAGYIEGWCG